VTAGAEPSDSEAGQAPEPGSQRPRGPRARRLQAEAEKEQAKTGAPAADFEVDLPSHGDVLLYRVVECGVSYPKASRSWLVGPRHYRRMASVKVWASWVAQPGSRIQNVANGERLVLDDFPGSVRPVMEGRGYPFAIEQPSGASMRGIIEPVVIVGIVSGLVYLFYQNQK
jgi:hypothetical protein